MQPTRRAATALAALTLAAAAAAGACSGDDDAPQATSPGGADETVASMSTTTPAQGARARFCGAIVDLDRRLDDAGDVGESAVTEMIVEAYEAIEDDVPDEIRADFTVVLATLRGEPVEVDPDSDTDDLDPDVPDAAERFARYVDRECRRTADNPGPADTPPP